MTQTDLLDLLHFNYWANHRILVCAEQLTPEQLAASTHFDHKSALQTLLHMLDTEWGWRLIAQQVPAPQMMWEVMDLTDLAKLKHAWTADEQAMLAYVGSLDEQAINGPIPFGATQAGTPQTVKLWQIIAHIVHHSAYHRSELARYLTDCGHSPGDLDFLDFLTRQQRNTQEPGP